MHVDSWVDNEDMACVVIDGQFFNAEIGSILCEETDPGWNKYDEDDVDFMVNLPMENKTFLCLWIRYSGKSFVQLYHQEPEGEVPGLIDIPCIIEGAVIRPKPRGGQEYMDRLFSSIVNRAWEQEVQSANDIRQLLKQIGRMEVKP